MLENFVESNRNTFISRRQWQKSVKGTSASQGNSARSRILSSPSRCGRRAFETCQQPQVPVTARIPGTCNRKNRRAFVSYSTEDVKIEKFHGDAGRSRFALDSISSPPHRPASRTHRFPSFLGSTAAHMVVHSANERFRSRRVCHRNVLVAQGRRWPNYCATRTVRFC